MIGVNVQKGMPNPGCPVLAVVDDWMTDLTAFSQYDVAIWRTMNRSGYKLLPPNAHLTFDNEDDSGPDRSWRIPLVQQIRAERPDIKIHCPPEKVNERNQYDPALMAMCDIIDVHAAVFEPPAKDWFDKPYWITELEADPGYPAQMPQLVTTAEAWDRLGISCFIWGASSDEADINAYPDLLAQIRQYNQGVQPMPDYVIGPGFQAEIAKRGWHPASDEDYFAQSANAKVSVCVCEEGILWYSSASNKVGATPFA